MPAYLCPRCHYSTSNRSHFTRHFNQKRVCPPLFENEPPSSILDRLTTAQQEVRRYSCSMCSKSYVFASSLSAHKSKCKKRLSERICDTGVLENTQVDCTSIEMDTKQLQQTNTRIPSDLLNSLQNGFPNLCP